MNGINTLSHCSSYIDNKKIWLLILILLWTWLVATCIYVATNKYVDVWLQPKWHAFICSLVVVSLILSFFVFLEIDILWKKIYKYICLSTNILIIVEALLYLISKASLLSGLIPISLTIGHFDNVTGFSSCLSVSFPLGILLFRSLNNFQKAVIIMSKVGILAVVVSCESRTGVICIISSVLFTLFYYGKIRKVTMAFVFSSFIVICATLFKTPSSQGRLFILSRTIEMIKKRPISGWGHNGFCKNYMDIQANYFSLHPESRYRLLADNIHHPLNEYLLVAVNYGIPMLAICLLFIIITACHYFRHTNRYSSEGFMVLLTITTYAFFSYPFSYPFTWLMLCLSLLVVFASSVRKGMFRNIALVAFLLSDLIIAHAVFPFTKSFHNQLDWKKASLHSCSRKSIDKYDTLYTQMKSDYHFLYDYACVAYDLGQYEKALLLANEAALFVSDYNLTLLLADIYNVLSEKDKALSYYDYAHDMCPSRIAPYYETYKIYSVRNDTLNCFRLFKEVNSLHIKVNNFLTEAMLSEIKKDFQRFIINH